MKKTVILLSQSYLQFASEAVLLNLSQQIRLVLVITHNEEVYPFLSTKLAKVYHVNGNTTESLRPELNFDQVSEIVKQEIALVDSSKDIAIYCQQEDNVLTAAKLRLAFDIDGEQTDIVLKFRDKLIMKQCISAVLPNAIPKHKKLDIELLNNNLRDYYHELKEFLGEKMIVKPTTGAGSFNIKIINSEVDLQDVKEMISTDEHTFSYEIDEFISGKMYQCDSFIRNGKVVFCGILELGCSNFDFVMGKPLSVYPVTSIEQYQRLFEFNQTLITELGLKNGSTHHELFIKDNSQDIVFLEIAARVPGGIGVPFHTKNSNINLIDATLLQAAESDELNKISPNMKNNVVSALLPVGHGTVIALNEPQLMSHWHIDWHVKVGDVVNSRSLIDTAGILMFTNDNREQLRSDFEKLQDWVPVTCI
ncbi:ATP-grasp domain-containing protein [Providencia stuartii]|uniref:ATP-grasp domain-containing protein n=2 Tax=Providencia stuartii TaxID=588 RepID=UPI001C1322A6|nr:ATP-grasp domain-containing protein [Providencia stuartii]MDT7048497.1 ATP-grasp domain-containing protein [Providencia stuartii]HEM6915368.1 ATP-grasp domain-containing protein [Providencia stuartii]HEM7168294.1 ATP-grasp domain-containing protein [Providencia stuartii]